MNLIRKINPVILARILIILQLVTICISTAATSVSEVLIYLTFISSGLLRSRVLAVLRQPMVIMTLVIWAMVGIGTLYSAAPFADAFDVWGSWRKCLLLPLAAAVFDDPAWKKHLLNVFIGLMGIAALLSFASSFFAFNIVDKYPMGIVIANHATQAVFFSVAAFACLLLIIFTGVARAWVIWAAAAVITANLIFITPGRSGYLSFMVFTMLIVFWKTEGRIRLFLMPLIPVGVVLILLASSTSRDRIQMGIQEIETYETTPEITSMGTRMVFWTNTLAILKKAEHPIIGYGTDGFKIPYTAQVKGQKGWQGVGSTDPHNQYLKILVEYGIIGLILFFVFIASFFRQAVPPPFYYLGIGLLIAWCATSLFNGHFGTFHEGRLFFLWCGVMLAEQNSGRMATGDPICEA